jgi:hypothetical protein
MLFTRNLVGWMVASVIVGALAAVVDCGAADSCLRYSDCDDGYTCASGLCVVAPIESGDGGDDDSGGTSSGEDASSSSSSDASPVVLIDAMTTTTTTGDDAGDSSAAIGDASTD